MLIGADATIGQVQILGAGDLIECELGGLGCVVGTVGLRIIDGAHVADGIKKRAPCAAGLVVKLNLRELHAVGGGGILHGREIHLVGAVGRAVDHVDDRPSRQSSIGQSQRALLDQRPVLAAQTIASVCADDRVVGSQQHI